jgi:hypothetical protein
MDSQTVQLFAAFGVLFAALVLPIRDAPVKKKFRKLLRRNSRTQENAA